MMGGGKWFVCYRNEKKRNVKRLGWGREKERGIHTFHSYFIPKERERESDVGTVTSTPLYTTHEKKEEMQRCTCPSTN